MLCDLGGQRVQLLRPAQARLRLLDREPHRTAVQLALECGARLQSELLPITWPDINLDRAQLTITATHSKNGRARHLPLTPAMAARPRTMQATSTSPLVFASPRGGLLRNFKNVYFPAVRRIGRAGTGLGIHTLRHSWSSRMVEAGCDLVLLQHLGGWSSLAMVSRYSHYRQERAVDATARMLAAGEGASRDLPQISPQPLATRRRTGRRAR